MGNFIRILVIDDEISDRHLFRVTLEKALDKVKIIEADNWNTLTKMLDQYTFDIILTDYKLIGFNGLDVIDEVQRRSIKTPIIMVSGTGTEEIAIEAMRRGVHDYVLKSFKHIKRLPAMVTNLVANTSSEQQHKIGETDPYRYIGAFENAPYGVVLIDEQGVIVQANRVIKTIIGISSEKLIGKKILTITHPDDADATLIFHNQLFSGEIENYEQQKRYLHNQCNAIWTEELSSIIYDEQSQARYAVLQIKDISERKRSEDMLQNIARGVSAETGQQFFYSLTQHLAESLLTDNAFVCEFVDNQISAVKYTAAFCKGKFFNAGGHEVAGTPYQNILNNGIQSHASNVQTAYPSFTLLKELNADSLVGATLFHSEGHPLGIVAVIHSKPIENIELTESMLKIFSVRAAAELERQHSAKALEDSEKRYRTLYDENPSMFFTLNLERKLLSVNKYGAAQLGYSVSDLIGRLVSDIAFEQDRQIESEFLDLCFDQPQSVQHWEQRLIRKDGNMIWVRQSARIVINPEGITNVLIVSENISEAHRLSEQLSYQAIHDPLTNLLNRREFERRLKILLETARTENTEHALCYMDLDQFKIINDTLGHVAGDELLRQLGQLLSKLVRKQDTLARLGGDEFGILIEDCSLSQATRVANAVLNAIKQYQFIWEEKSLKIGVSIGLIVIKANSGSTTDVFSEVATACYLAKDNGRNRIHIFRDNDEALAQHKGEMQWVTIIQKGLEQDRFCLFYQPILPLTDKSDQGTHFELLIRMVNDEGQIVSPDAFLPAAERYNLSTSLDQWVVKKSFEFLSSNRVITNNLALCSINLSGLSLGNGEFLEYICNKVKNAGFPGEKICFEITETAAIANLTSAIHFIRTLKSLGCKFALDDFGSGLSSFAYLKTLPVDYLKIDGVFVRDIVNDPIDCAMVNSINDIGHVMGKKTVAEFVENEEILLKLEKIGVDYVQGYYLGVPRPLTELIDQLTIEN